jgi:hypothetical protein
MTDDEDYGHKRGNAKGDKHYFLDIEDRYSYASYNQKQCCTGKAMITCNVRMSSIICIVVVLLIWGCRGEQATLSPAAKTFKKDIGDIVKEVSELVLDDLLKNDQTAVRVFLEKYWVGLATRDKPIDCGIAILDKNGLTLTGQYSEETVKAFNFSNYELVKKVFRDRNIAQGELFLQDGARLYAIAAPIGRGETVYGLVGLAFSAQKLAELWGISEREFMAVDFNK